jgi:hypothetical protein
MIRVLMITMMMELPKLRLNMKLSKKVISLLVKTMEPEKRKRKRREVPLKNQWIYLYLMRSQSKLWQNLC